MNERDQEGITKKETDREIKKEREKMRELTKKYRGWERNEEKERLRELNR